MASPLLIFLGLMIVLPLLNSRWQHLPQVILMAVLLLSIAMLAPNRVPSLHYQAIPVPGELQDRVATWSPGAADVAVTDVGREDEVTLVEKKFVETLDI
jgi:beta-lactamase superfamily II metal-dependent hydrolase